MKVICVISNMNTEIWQEFKVSKLNAWNLVFLLFRMREHQEEVVTDYKKDGKN